MGRVRNILVSDVEQFEEVLVRELILNQISYVKIENEFHFLECIYRIYDLEMVAKSVVLNKNIITPQICIINSESISKLIVDYDSHINLSQSKVDFCKDSYRPKTNKQLIKQQNRKVNSILNKK